MHKVILYGIRVLKLEKLKMTRNHVIALS